MVPSSAGHGYALRLRVGRQTSLLSPLLARLHARLRQIPDAAVVAVTRSEAPAPSEARALIHLPGYPCSKARNLMVAWAETTIDALNDEQPYATQALPDREPGRAPGYYRTLVCCEQADARLWLRAHAAPRTAAALLALTEHLPALLAVDLALLKTAMPVAISMVLEARHSGLPAAALSALVFANTPAGRQPAELLRKRLALERDGRLLGHADLPADALAVCAQLAAALRRGVAAAGTRGGGGFTVIRILLNQLGFEGQESDYLILLALPPETWSALRRQQEHGHAT